MIYTDLKGVPMFKEGVRRGERYDKARLTRMVRNSNLMRPYFRGIIKTKLTHAGRQPDVLQQAALGQNTRYYLRQAPDGLYMMGDFSGVPKPVADVAPKHFPNVSVEKYRQFKPGDGRRVPDVVKSVAFLGADAPEVKGLKLVYPEVFQDDPHGDIEIFQLQGQGEEPMTIGEVIAAKREELGMSPEDLAGVVGISPEELASIESGQIEPDEALLSKIADAFGMTVEELQQAAKPDEKPEDEKKEKEPPATFGEVDLESIVLKAVEQATRPYKTRITALERKLTASRTELFAERQNTRQQAVASKLDALFEPNKNGKALPAVLKKMGVQEFMETLEDRNVEHFGEGDDKTALDCFTEMLEKVKEVGLVDTTEQAGGDYERPDPDDPDAAIEKYAEEHDLEYGDAASEMSKKGILKV